MKLADYLEEADLSLREFAAQVDCDIDSLSRIVRGLQIPRHTLLLRICVVTDGKVTPNDLYGIDGRNLPSSGPPVRPGARGNNKAPSEPEAA